LAFGGHISQKASRIHKVFTAFFVSSDEKIASLIVRRAFDGQIMYSDGLTPTYKMLKPVCQRHFSFFPGSCRLQYKASWYFMAIPFEDFFA
jgi:hypothetical protein